MYVYCTSGGIVRVLSCLLRVGLKRSVFALGWAACYSEGDDSTMFVDYNFIRWMCARTVLSKRHTARKGMFQSTILSGCDSDDSAETSSSNAEGRCNDAAYLCRGSVTDYRARQCFMRRIPGKGGGRIFEDDDRIIVFTIIIRFDRLLYVEWKTCYVLRGFFATEHHIRSRCRPKGRLCLLSLFV